MGNILTASNGTSTHTYSYTNTDWKDLLTAFDGEAISYDASGNPTSYYNGTRWAFTWTNGRNLTTASTTDKTISYTYDLTGLRTSKTVNGVTHDYLYAGGKLLRETYGDTVLDFFYDANGTAYAFKYSWRRIGCNYLTVVGSPLKDSRAARYHYQAALLLLCDGSVHPFAGKR